MFTRRSIHGLMTTAITLAALQAHAAGTPPAPAPTPVLHDGRYYEVVIVKRITWDAAKAAAEQRTYLGIQGQLATIGSLEEDIFVHQLRQQALSELPSKELWVGGFQLPCATSTPEPGCGWVWLNGDPISPVNTDTPYTNWLNGEPNNLRAKPDVNQRASEDQLAIGLDGKFGWNDEGNLNNIAGYLIEYGDKVTISATTCTAGAGGCNPTGAQVLEYPPAAKVEDGATLTASTFRIHDDPNRCGREPLTLFDGAVVIPEYLCGHPDFIVIHTEAEGVEILNGATLVENLTEDVLPDNLFGCTSVRQNPAGVIDRDPSHRDVVAWQTTDRNQMLETALGSGRFLGTVAEVTYGCGSSRGKVVSGSYHFVGLRIHPGTGNEFTDGNKPGNHQSFVDLTRYKLKLLQASVVESKVALPKLTYTVLKTLVDAALHFHDKGQYKLALLNVKLFVKAVELSKYKPVAGENFSGDHNMRGSNLEFMYTEKVLPFD